MQSFQIVSDKTRVSRTIFSPKFSPNQRELNLKMHFLSSRKTEDIELTCCVKRWVPGAMEEPGKEDPQSET